MDFIDNVICNNICNNVTKTKESITTYMKILAKSVERDIDKPTKLPKISDNDFIIPNINEISLLVKYNYNLQQLKKISKNYKLKVTGNKIELFNRIYVFICLSQYIIKIQKYYRGYLFRKYLKLHGDGLRNRSLCTNETDFLSGDKLTDIKYPQFVSFKDEDGFIYGFDMVSLHNLLIRGGLKTQNPYNRSVLSRTIISNINKLINLSKVLKQSITLDIDENILVENNISTGDRITNLFHNIDLLGNYSNPGWFIDLNCHQLIKLLREILDIWMYRAQLPYDTRRNICPGGNPFRNLNLNELLVENDIDVIRRKTLTILENIVNTGIDQDSQALGSFYVLGAITLVNPEAAGALPWLFQSMNY